ncbi:MAG: hypothetical protein E7528_07905 [Ruminococcaceae bacterium]|nr:hypothetical protein [Oscillospiraceae bacterium]
MKNNKDTNKSKFSFSELVRDNRFIAVLSFVIAFVIWIWIAIEKSPEVQQVITDVPVQLNLENTIPEQLGLQIFGESEFNVDVTVKGKKYIVASLEKDDIQVVANINRVDSAGLWTLQLKVAPTDGSDDFTISSSSQTFVEVYFDKYKELEVALEGIVDTKLESYVPEDCLAGDIVLSKNTVLISGPASEINRVTGVSATATIENVLEKTTTFDTKIVINTTDGIPLEYTSINAGDGNITMAVPVLKVVTLPTAVEFKNAPSYFINTPLKYTVYPSTVKVAIPVDTIDTTEHFIVDTIDFADISNSYNTFYVNTDSITSYKIMDENIKRFRISVNASDMSTKTMSIPSSAVKIKNDRDDFDVRLNSTKDITVTLVGPQADIDAITADNIRIEVDTADKTIVNDTKVLQGKVIVSGDYNCWAIGKYDIKVAVKPQ